MFGFLNPEKHSDEYRSVYSRCCQHQRSNNGVLSLPFLSYESVFLYLFWLDATSQKTGLLPLQRCCKLKKLDDDVALEDGEVGEFCSALSMLLAGTKLDDDIRDSASFRARFVNAALRSPIRRGRGYFERLSADFSRVLGDKIAAHLELENRSEHIHIEEYAQPTAESFGYVFRQFAKLPSMSRWEDVLYEQGKRIGAALIAFDCAADWRRDQKNGDFNPLVSWQEVEESVVFARESLRQAELTSLEVFGDESSTANLLQGVKESIVSDEGAVLAPMDQLSPRGRLAALGGLSTLLLGSSESDSDCGACCCGIVCLAIAASACKGNVVGSVTSETDCCGNKKAVVRKAGPCDNC